MSVDKVVFNLLVDILKRETALELFIGLVFDSNSIHYQKIESYKKRFDPKFSFSNNIVQLTLLAPFEIDFKSNFEYQNFRDGISEIIEGHLYGVPESNQIEFNGMNFSMGKKNVLGLTPKISLDLDHLKESLFYYLKEEGVRFKKFKENKNLMLPLGRFDFNDQVESAISLAQIEFSDPFVMYVKNFGLFERNAFQWNIKQNLYEFYGLKDLNFVNNLWAN